MSLENRDREMSVELLTELTGRPVEDFELSDDFEIPDRDGFKYVSTEEFYNDE